MSIAPGQVDETTVVAPARHVGTVAVGERAVLVDESAGRGWALNASGALIWRLFDGKSPLGDLVNDLSDVLGAPRHEVADSVVGLASFLGELGLLDGVLRNLASVPVDIEYVDVDDCGEVIPAADLPAVPTFDSRYLAAPPNL